MSEVSNHKSGYVALVGPANSGKSTLLNAILGKKVSIVSPRPQTTRNRVLGIKNSSDSQLIFLDTPGFLRKHDGELGRYIDRALRDTALDVDLFLLVVDALKLRNRADAVKELFYDLKHYRMGAPAVVALNKIDLMPKDQLLGLIERLDGELSKSAGGKHDASIVPLSALKHDGIGILEQELFGRLPEGPAYFPKDAVTDQTEEFFVSEVVREKLFLNLNQELPYSTAVKLEGWEEKDNLIRIKAIIYVERDSQKPIVIGKGGERLKSVGTAARLELEKFFGTRIFLELFVRVEKEWTKTKKGMRKAGYH